MSDLGFPLSLNDVQRVVATTAMEQASRYGFFIHPDAVAALTSRALTFFQTRAITADPERLRQATQTVMDEMLGGLDKAAVPNQQINANVVTDFFRGFCHRYPDFFPFCV